ncbi:MAG: trypsin-like peptidase domain-containing protein [Clostridia bacterium]|nr:trypsin-like peptidase domain-containing protein [Clostridia bacterium]
MKRKITAALLLLLSLALTLSSCALFDGEENEDYVTRDELDRVIANLPSTSIGGDTNNIDITLEGANDVISASKAVLSVVSIECKFRVYQTVIGWGTSYTKEVDATAEGSGVIYSLDKSSGDAYIITNYHVVYNKASVTENGICNDITLYLYGQEYEQYAIPATYVGGSLSYDLAVLKVEGNEILKNSSAAAVELENSDSAALLESVIVIGNANGYGISATAGYINVDSEYITMYGADGVTAITVRVMRTSAPINSGNSGGGMFSSEGKLLGIVNAKIVDTTTDNIGFAIPSNIAKYVTENIIYYCDGKPSESVHRCILGITPTTVSSKAVYNTEDGTVRVEERVAVGKIEEGAAIGEGLSEGDIINSITIDGKEYSVKRLYNVIDCMLNARVGSTVTFNIIRGGKSLAVTVQISDDMLTAVK